jgi:hypothetical protein
MSISTVQCSVVTILLICKTHEETSEIRSSMSCANLPKFASNFWAPGEPCKFAGLISSCKFRRPNPRNTNCKVFFSHFMELVICFSQIQWPFHLLVTYHEPLFLPSLNDQPIVISGWMTRYPNLPTGYPEYSVVTHTCWGASMLQSWNRSTEFLHPKWLPIVTGVFLRPPISSEWPCFSIHSFPQKTWFTSVCQFNAMKPQCPWYALGYLSLYASCISLAAKNCLTTHANTNPV